MAPSLATLPTAGAYVPATGAAAAATSAPPPTANPAGPATAALTWASAGAGVASPGRSGRCPFGVAAGAGTAPFAPAAVVPIGAAAGQPRAGGRPRPERASLAPGDPRAPEAGSPSSPGRSCSPACS